MFSRFFITFILVKIGSTQLDGEFWWLKDEFTKFVGTRPPAPQFENLSEMDNDENAKITFKDDNYFRDNSNTISKPDLANHKEERISKEASRHNIRWPDKEGVFNNVQHNVAEDQVPGASDKFIFKFPKDDNVFTRKNPTTQNVSVPSTESNHINVSQNRTDFLNDKIYFPLQHNEKLSENICTYMKKSDCYQNKGVINIDVKDEKYTTNGHLICCILPLKARNENVPQKISLPTNKKHKRRIRSKNAQTQRNILLINNYPQHNHKTKQAVQTAYDDYEYEDPYVNIKNHKNPKNHKQDSNLKYEYNNDDYQEDYAVEIPTPGLTGLYSENENKDESIVYDDEADNSDFGYSTIDPRIASHKNRKSKPRRKPAKLTPASDEAYDVDSQTISYQSDPSFNVLQDFKLPNLKRKKKLKVPRSTTTESFSINDSEETVHIQFDQVSEIRQVYNSCGKTTKPLITTDKQIGYTEKGSHPWLALLVPTHKQNKLLCYASLIHPRAAISAGDCVHSTAPGEVTIIAGLWHLTERPLSGKRVVIPLLHPMYKSGFMDNNLAMLHWKQPLKLGINVQPICLAKPSTDHECVFVGWGGFDQAIRTKSRWQRATLHNCQDHTSLIGLDIPSEAFCASVKSRSTVTGIGGSLICRTDDHFSAVGVAVSRDSTLILLPTYEWITSPSIESFIGVPEE